MTLQYIKVASLEKDLMKITSNIVKDEKIKTVCYENKYLQVSQKNPK